MNDTYHNHANELEKNIFKALQMCMCCGWCKHTMTSNILSVAIRGLAAERQGHFCLFLPFFQANIKITVGPQINISPNKIFLFYACSFKTDPSIDCRISIFLTYSRICLSHMPV